MTHALDIGLGSAAAIVAYLLALQRHLCWAASESGCQGAEARCCSLSWSRVLAAQAVGVR
jgi:hypothetical protein